MEPIDDQMLYVTFNQDNSCFVVGTERGFRIYNSYPYKDYYERVLEGGIGIVEMLNRTNILALVGGGKYPKYSRNKVIIWDDNQGKVIGELSFNTYIKNIKLKKDKIYIVCDTKIYIFNLINFQNIDTVDTFENLKGIISITYDPAINLLAYPDKASGYVKLKSYDKNETILINAHESKIACLMLSSDGIFLATASEKGTVIRIFRTEDGTFIYEYIRGRDRCEIYSICFDVKGKYIACSCSASTIHVFNMKNVYEKLHQIEKDDELSGRNKKQNDNKENRVNEIIATRKKRTFWEKIGGSLPIPKYFNAEPSFADFNIPEAKSISALIPSEKHDMLIVVSNEGRYYQATFNPDEPGLCTKVEELSLNININTY